MSTGKRFCAAAHTWANSMTKEELAAFTAAALECGTVSPNTALVPS
jgi:hypothetical protein